MPSSTEQLVKNEVKQESDEEFLSFAESEDEFEAVDDDEFLSLAAAAEEQNARDTGLEDLLHNTFGIPSFRHPQKEVIQKVVDGESAVVIMPTGGGKSLCYQLPALAIDGLTVVVSPLIALMKDQTESLQRKGIAANSIDSTKSAQESESIMARVRKGEMKILFVAPERLLNEDFMKILLDLRDGISFIAIDEAHCISEWGHSFRPDYLKIARFIEEMKVKRVVCLTATGTGNSQSCGGHILQLAIEPIKSEAKFDRLVKFLKGTTGTAIVYVSFKKQAEEIASRLREVEIDARGYHGGMAQAKRAEAQSLFMTAKNIVIVATIAFGMGIDRPDIRAIVHYNMPKTLEGYSQEIGRAGRDGELSKCLYFLCNKDVALQEMFARASLPTFKNVFGLLSEFFGQDTKALVGSVLKAKKHWQSVDWDMGIEVQSNIYAQLELQHDLIREISPIYDKHSYRILIESTFMDDFSPEASAIRRFSEPKAQWITIDTYATAWLGNIDRSRILRKLHDLHKEDVIDFSDSAMMHRYRVLKPLPTTAAEVLEIATDLYERLKKRQADEIIRFKAAVSFATKAECLPAQLTAHFEDTMPNGKCDQCSFCLTKRAATYTPLPSGFLDTNFMDKLIQIYGQYGDARLIVKIAFGITSPKIAHLKISKTSDYGKIKKSQCDFDEVLSQTEMMMRDQRLLD